MKSLAAPVGSVAPDFTLPAVDGRDRSLADCRNHKAVVIFYRGHWCGACRRQLAALREGVLELEDCGATVLAISAEPIERARESAERDGLTFTILSDETLVAIDRYGVRHVDEPEGRAIARPAVFLLDRAGIVRYAHIGEDPLDRPGLQLIRLGLETID
ncbi:MAG: redoxin domain-containing protein [Thermomicrobiales bacterium]|nr:redoxin domain-containing protein [Thermomicrobiales bacterium]